MYTPKMNKPTVLSVSQLNYYVKSVLENDPRLSMVVLSAEIAKATVNRYSGHMYLDLKDSNAVVEAVMYAGNLRRLPFTPEVGMKVLCQGKVSLYEKSGSYQVIVENMQPDGVGALALAFEQLKKRLEAQGLFNQAHQKPLPRFPKTVGVVTSPTGAALHDIRNVISRRAPFIKILLSPASVQGNAAAPQLIEALQRLDSSGLCDVIIIGRGGGSPEDLWAFNNEALAHAIYNCHTPVISAVGHETDFTICDFVADLRAPTPSAAAELAVPDIRELEAGYLSRVQILHRLMESRLNSYHNQQLNRQNRLSAASPAKELLRLSGQLQLSAQRLRRAEDKIISNNELKLKKTAAKLESLNPLSVLSRGFATVEQDGKMIGTAAALDRERDFTLTFSDAKITAKATGE